MGLKEKALDLPGIAADRQSAFLVLSLTSPSVGQQVASKHVFPWAEKGAV